MNIFVNKYSKIFKYHNNCHTLISVFFKDNTWPAYLFSLQFQHTYYSRHCHLPFLGFQKWGYGTLGGLGLIGFVPNINVFLLTTNVFVQHLSIYIIKKNMTVCIISMTVFVLKCCTPTCLAG